MRLDFRGQAPWDGQQTRGMNTIRGREVTLNGIDGVRDERFGRAMCPETPEPVQRDGIDRMTAHTSVSTIADAVEALRQGRPIIAADNEGRENEGDVVIAAELASQEWIARIIRCSSGSIFAPMTNEIAYRRSLEAAHDGRGERGSAGHCVHGVGGRRRLPVHGYLGRRPRSHPSTPGSPELGADVPAPGRTHPSTARG